MDKTDVHELKSKNSVECQHCNGKFKDPRSLPCSHIICRKCLKETSKNSKESDRALCPECIEQSAIHTSDSGSNDAGPVSGNNSLIGSNRSESVDSSEDGTTISDGNDWCEKCSMDETGRRRMQLAVSFCESCNEKLCETCAKDHMKTGRSKQCKLTSLTGKGWESGDDQESNSTLSCPRHAGKDVELFCVTCVEATCVMCFIERHQMHRCRNFDNVLDDFRRELQTISATVTKSIEKCRGMLTGFEEIDERNADRASRVESEINERAEQLKELIDLHKRDLLLEVRMAEADRERLSAKMATEMKQRVMAAEDFLSSVDRLTEKGSVVEVAQKLSGVRRRVDEITAVANEINDDYNMHSRSDGFKFNSAFLTTSTDNNFVGRVDVDSQRSGTVQLDKSNRTPGNCEATTTHSKLQYHQLTVFPRSRKPEKKKKQSKVKILANHETKDHASLKLTHAILEDKPVQGLALLADHLFVIRHQCEQEIQVYDVDKFTLKRRLKVTGLKDCRYCECRLASCSRYQCLYVCNRNSNSIYQIRVESSRNDGALTTIVSKWRIGNEPSGISVNVAGHVLVTCRDGSIREYTRSGKPIRAILLDKNTVGNPFHAVQPSNDRLIVSHWQPKSGVSVVNVQGQLIYAEDQRDTATSSGKRQTAVRPALDHPTQLALLKNGGVLVADRDNNRIIFFPHSSLQTGERFNSDVKVLSVDVALQKPFALCVDELNGRMYVGESTGRVLMFDFKCPHYQ